MNIWYFKEHSPMKCNGLFAAIEIVYIFTENSTDAVLRLHQLSFCIHRDKDVGKQSDLGSFR